MAGIGVKLNKIYNKNTLTTNLVGRGYSTVITIAPMIMVIFAIVAMQLILRFQNRYYAARSCLPALSFLYLCFSPADSGP